MPSSDKKLAFSVKKAATCEVPNKGANIVNMSQGISPLPKDRGPSTDPGKAVGAKRLQTTKEQEAQQNVLHDQTNKPEVSSPIAESGDLVSSESPEKPNGESVPEKNEPPIASGTTVQGDMDRSRNQYWNERFNRLQMYLENCDRSTREGYMQMLRSLSSAG